VVGNPNAQQQDSKSSELYNQRPQLSPADAKLGPC
jgi:hypothetical protein